jgi:hypothetical protein
MMIDDYDIIHADIRRAHVGDMKKVYKCINPLKYTMSMLAVFAILCTEMLSSPLFDVIQLHIY